MQGAVPGQDDGGVRVDVVPEPGGGSAAAAGRASRQHGTGRRHAPDAAGARPGGVGRRRDARRDAAAARRAVLDRRRTGDAGRAAAPGRDLQLQPLHAARPLLAPTAASAPTSASCPTRCRRPARRCAARPPDNDLIVTSGGVSVGEEDHLRPAVQAEGRLDLWQVAIKPGKPFRLRRDAAADGAGQAWFIGLPGNPVSSFVTFLLAVRPVLLRLQGAAAVPALPPTLRVRADFDWPRPDRRREFVRVRRNAEGALDLFPNQSSAVLTSAVWGDGVVDIAPGQAIRRGDGVRYLSFADLLASP